MKRTEGFRSCPSKPHSSLIPALSFILRLKQFNCLFIFVAFFHYFFLSFYPYFSKAFLKCAYKSLHNDFYKCRSYDQTRSAYCKYLLFLFSFVQNFFFLSITGRIWICPCVFGLFLVLRPSALPSLDGCGVPITTHLLSSAHLDHITSNQAQHKSLFLHLLLSSLWLTLGGCGIRSSLDLYVVFALRFYDSVFGFFLELNFVSWIL